MSNNPWIVVPAAGLGERMGGSIPKQYLDLNGQSVLQTTLTRLLQVPSIEGIVVVLAADDALWSTVEARLDPRVHRVTGGDTRAHSVLCGLDYVMNQAAEDVWVLVHDAARPLIHVSDIKRLSDAVINSGASGGILATPVQDTLKRADEYYCIEVTVNRQDLWQAQTPQMFRAGQLLEAMQSASKDKSSDSQSGHSRSPLTDEASAMESLAHTPLLVEALRPNIKITRPVDLEMVKVLLRNENDLV